MRIDQTFVALDLELTGLDQTSDTIIEVAALKFRGGEVLESFSSLVNPRRPLPHKIARLTGISQAELHRAPSFSEVASRLVAFVRDHPLVGHSVENDMAALARHGVALSNSFVDTFELTNVVLPELAGRGLESLATELGFGAGQFHRAAADAAITKDLFRHLAEQAMDLDVEVIQEINRLAAGTDWPLREFFAALEKEKARTIFSGGASFRQLLAAKRGLEEASLDSLMLNRDPVEPLEPVQPRRTVDPDALAGLLQPDGPFAQSFPGYEHRPQQVEMLREVAAAINDKRTLLVEAGTGTGKSLAYLLPAAKFAVDNGEHVVVSTKTINLQDQLFTKDIPRMQQFLPFEVKAALLKGRSNYLCLRRYGLERRRSGLTRDEAVALIKVLVWLPTTSAGDWAELSLTAAEKAFWARISAEGQHCLGPSCPVYRKRACFLYRARWQAAAAHLIVVNHALLLSESGSETGVLPEYRYLVVDEAHNLEDVATDQFSYAVGRREVDDLVDDISREVAGAGRVGTLNDVLLAVRSADIPAAARRESEPLLEKAHNATDEVRKAVRQFSERVAAFVGLHSSETRDYNRRLRLTRAVRANQDWETVEDEWETLQLRLTDLETALSQLATAVSVFVEDGLPDGERLLQSLDTHVARSAELRTVGNALAANPDPAYVQWAEEHQYQGATTDASLRGAPLHVGEMLQNRLFENLESAVLTSATLSVAGSFDYVAGRLGLLGERTLVVDSPFDYRASTLVYVATDVPEPGTPGHQKAVERAITELCRASEGRAMVLFTSHSQLAATFHAIRRPLQEDEILVLAQRIEGTSRRQLLRTFRSNPRTVLLGSVSFWEGVDVVGDALSVLAITKLPFAVPTDPVFAARSEAVDDPFRDFSLPQTVLKFKQGFGRLIRSHADRGVFVVLDKRILTKSYGSAFVRSLPKCTLQKGTTDDLVSAASRWLAADTDSH